MRSWRRRHSSSAQSPGSGTAAAHRGAPFGAMSAGSSGSKAGPHGGRHRKGEAHTGSEHRSHAECKVMYSEEASTIAVSFDSSSDVSTENGKFADEVILWDEIAFGARIYPYHRYAQSAHDIYLLSCFLELTQLADVDGETVKLLLRTVKFLRLCDYSIEDISSILAHASSYFVDAYSLCGSQMDSSEVGNVLATLMFMAHCYVQDETCPLHIWHQHLFAKYCPLKTLNAAVIRLMEIRRYVLRLETEDLNRRFSRLLQANQKHRAAPATDPGPYVQEEEVQPLSTTDVLFRKLMGQLNCR